MFWPDNWCNYPKGVMWRHIHRRVIPLIVVLIFLYYGNIPNGSGLSSSCPIRSCNAVILNDQFGFDVDMVEVMNLPVLEQIQRCKLWYHPDQFISQWEKQVMQSSLDAADAICRLSLQVNYVIACSNKKRGLQIPL